MTYTPVFTKKVFLDASRQYQVRPDCYPVDQKCYEVYYVLPPVMEWFYKKHSPLFRPLPAFYPGCGSAASDEVMSFIYPKVDTRLTIPIGITFIDTSIYVMLCVVLVIVYLSLFCARLSTILLVISYSCACH